MAAQQQSLEISGRPASGLSGRSSPVGPSKTGNKEFGALKTGNKEEVALKTCNKEVGALKTGNKEEELGEQVISRFPPEKRRNSFEEMEEQKGKWRRRESSKQEDFDNIVEMEEEMVEVRKMAVEEKQMMDDVAILMRKVADALAEFAMDQSVDNLRSLGLEE